MINFKTFVLFIVAGLCEIGGGYLVWLWMKEGKPLWYVILGGLVLVVYGLVTTYQPANFARVYATYGGVFVVMSLLLGYSFDNYIPDKYDIIGALFVLLGVAIIYYSPRTY